MIPEKALKLAMEAGYKPKYSNKRHQDHWFGFEERMDVCLPTLALDSAFWQALYKRIGGKHLIEKTALHMGSTFCHLILTGGDTKKFWDDLLNKTV